MSCINILEPKEDAVRIDFACNKIAIHCISACAMWSTDLLMHNHGHRVY